MSDAKRIGFQLITGVIIIAIVFMLVRPGSPAAKAVADTSNALASLVRSTTEYTAGGTSNG